MAQVPRIVFDTSVMISVAGRPAIAYSTWKAVLHRELLAVTCEGALSELRDVLTRPKIREHYGAALDLVNVEKFIEG